MLAVGRHVVGEQVIVGDLVTLLGVVPEPAGVFANRRSLSVCASHSAAVIKRFRHDWSIVWANSVLMPLTVLLAATNSP